MTIYAILPLSRQQEAEAERLWRKGHTDYYIASQLCGQAIDNRVAMEGQVRRHLDRKYPQYRKKNLQGS